MQPRPGSKSTKFDRTMKMKKVVANGKTQRVTFGSSKSPIKFPQPSTKASTAFCPPVGISFKFQVVTRTITKINNATIQVQTIEFVTGSGPMLKSVGAISATGGFSDSA